MNECLAIAVEPIAGEVTVDCRHFICPYIANILALEIRVNYFWRSFAVAMATDLLQRRRRQQN